MPVFMTQQAEAGILLVSEPGVNRIGRYHIPTMEFKVIAE